MVYYTKDFENADYDNLIIEEKEWELTLPSGHKIISKTITTNDVFIMSVVYTLED